MLSSFLNRVRSVVSVCVLLAFWHCQMSGLGVERLIPGAPLTPAGHQQPATPPAQPGEVQQPATPAAPAPKPDAPPPQPEPETTVVQVPVPKEGSLDITIVEGDGGSNVVGKKSSVRPVIEVRDEKNQLVEGAVVTFVAPADGPSVVFGNGLRTVTVMTDAQGRARPPAMKAVNTGSFRVQVSASYKGQMVSTAISQTNFESAAEAKGGVAPSSTPRRTTATSARWLTRRAAASLAQPGRLFWAPVPRPQWALPLGWVIKVRAAPRPLRRAPLLPDPAHPAPVRRRFLFFCSSLA